MSQRRTLRRAPTGETGASPRSQESTYVFPRREAERGASAVELALLFPVIAILLFGIIEFGIAFLQIQSIRTGVREGGRAAAVGAQVSTTRQRTIDASVGSIPAGHAGFIQVSSSAGGLCTPQNIGSDVTVTYDTSHLPGGGVVVAIPMMSDMVLKPVIKASFRCEV
ncbi:MAG TPA: TadE/TadG family type IV pilus assembly protein [Actinomycetota bacterium]|nr:TadE/TadG family type IV pilus assembly protein [Actinomycetota bacterium]